MEKLDHLGWVVQESYEIGGFRFGLRTTSESFGQWVGNALGAYRVEGEEDPRYSVVVADSDSTRPGRPVHLLYLGTWTIARTTQLPALRRALVEQLASLQHPERRDALFLDAMLLESNGRLAIAPAPYLPVFVEARRRAERVGLRVPLSMSVAVDPDSGQVVPADPGLDLPASVAADLRISSDGILDIDRPRPVSTVLLPWSGTRQMMQPVSRGRGLYELSQKVANLPGLGGNALEGIERLLREARCYELVPAPTQVLLESVAGVVGNGGSPNRSARGGLR